MTRTLPSAGFSANAPVFTLRNHDALDLERILGADHVLDTLFNVTSIFGFLKRRPEGSFRRGSRHAGARP